jgi:hypothetical protein
MRSSYNNDCTLIKQSIGSLPSSDLDAMLLAHFFNPKLQICCELCEDGFYQEN